MFAFQSYQIINSNSADEAPRCECYIYNLFGAESSWFRRRRGPAGGLRRPESACQSYMNKTRWSALDCQTPPSSTLPSDWTVMDNSRSMTRYLAGLRLRVRELFTNLKDFKCFDFQPHDSKLIVVLQIYTQTAIQKLINEPFLLASCFRFMFYATMTRDHITVVTTDVCWSVDFGKSFGRHLFRWGHFWNFF